MTDVKTLADAQLLRLEKTEKAGQFLSIRLATRFRKAARTARRQKAILRVTEPFKQDLEDKMVRLALTAYLREYNLYKGLELSLLRPRNTYNIDLGNLKEKFRTLTGRVLRRNIETLEAQLNSAIRTINKQNLSEAESVQLLNVRFNSLGLVATNKGLTTSWMRLSLGIATGSARYDATQTDPSIWGYEYVTMRDNKVRPEHRTLDGYTRKKDDPIWLEIWPPNGWNCRCQVVPLIGRKRRQSRVKHDATDSVNPGFEGVPLMLAECGANAPGGGGFQTGNTCASSKGNYTVKGDRKPPKSLLKRIPPGWSNVRIDMTPGAKILVRGKDSKGRNVSVRAESATKAAKIKKFKTIKRFLKKTFTFSESEEGEALALIHATGLRPGSRVDTKAAKQAYGAVTLQGRHVVPTSEGVQLRFIGKKGVSLDIPVRDKKLIKMLLRRKQKAGETGDLFHTTQRLLLKRAKTHGFKTKDFRTGKGTGTAISAIKTMPKPGTMKEYKASVKRVSQIVAKTLGNTPLVALQSYIDPHVFVKWKAGVE